MELKILLYYQFLLLSIHFAVNFNPQDQEKYSRNVIGKGNTSLVQQQTSSIEINALKDFFI